MFRKPFRGSVLVFLNEVCASSTCLLNWKGPLCSRRVNFYRKKKKTPKKQKTLVHLFRERASFRKIRSLFIVTGS